jgi:hypothetical protein
MAGESTIQLEGEVAPPPAQLHPKEQAQSAPAANRSFDEFLLDVERGVPGAGKLLLFTGKQLRLDIMLLRHEKNPRVIWGLRHHEDWAFKATLLRFARVSQPVHLILSPEPGSGRPISGWVVGRSMDTFWATPMNLEQIESFRERSLEAWSQNETCAQAE